MSSGLAAELRVWPRMQKSGPRCGRRGACNTKRSMALRAGRIRGRVAAGEWSEHGRAGPSAALGLGESGCGKGATHLISIEP